MGVSHGEIRMYFSFSHTMEIGIKIFRFGSGVQVRWREKMKQTGWGPTKVG
jgi:hypothetical protein